MEKENLNTACDELHIDITTFAEAYFAYCKNRSERNKELYDKELRSIFNKLPSEIKNIYSGGALAISLGIIASLIGKENASAFRYSMEHGSCLIFDYKNKCFSIKDKAGKTIFGGEKEFYAEVDYIDSMIKEFTADDEGMLLSAQNEIVYHYMDILFSHDMICVLNRVVAEHKNHNKQLNK